MTGLIILINPIKETTTGTNKIDNRGTRRLKRFTQTADLAR